MLDKRDLCVSERSHFAPSTPDGADWYAIAQNWNAKISSIRGSRFKYGQRISVVIAIGFDVDDVHRFAVDECPAVANLVD